MSEFVIEKVEGFARPLLESMGLELVEVQFRREGHGWVLRLFIDSEDGVNVDHCARVSRELSDYLDVEDFVEHAYHLEVSSPGLERSLYKLDDFIRFVGRKARVKLAERHEGQRVFVGKIKSINDDRIELITDEGQISEFLYGQVKKARLTIE